MNGLLDLIDGGGFGQSGPRFEGGGLLSAIANLVATPYGSQRRAQEQSAPPAHHHAATPAAMPAPSAAPAASVRPPARPVSMMPAPPPVAATRLPPAQSAHAVPEMFRSLALQQRPDLDDATIRRAYEAFAAERYALGQWNRGGR